MISSWVWHSRSAQRRPWRSLSSNCSALGAGLGQRDFEAARDGGAQFALAPGMGFGKGFEVGDDRRAIDEFGRGTRGARWVSSIGARHN